MNLDLLPSLLTLPFHPTFWVTGIAWLGACLLKVLLLKIRTGDYQWDRFFGAGGMPSSHMAFATGLTASVGISEGFHSAVFGLALGLTILTAVDAAGVRRAAGLQAEIVNRLAEQNWRRRRGAPPRLKETLGHTLSEVMAGVALGAGIAFLLYPAPPLNP